MKYLLMIYQNTAEVDALPKEELRAVMDEATQIAKELTESGELIGGEALGHPSMSKAIRVRNGIPVVTDGPYLEAKEQLAGYAIVECATEERAVEIATRWPDARYWGVEVRPLMHGAGAEM